MTPTAKGIFWVSISYVFWGLSPIYWKLLAHVPPLDIMVHRVIWSFVFLLPCLASREKSRELTALLTKNRKTLLIIGLTSFLIVYNWFNFVLAMVTGRVLQSSLAYFLNPLMTICLGVVMLKEPLNKYQKFSVGIATLAVFFMVVRTGQVPGLALILAGTFALYGYLRKLVPVSGAMGLLVETALATPLMLAYLYVTKNWNYSWGTWLLLVGSGPFTATPLLWYIWGVRSLSLSTAGFLQFMTPFIQFTLAVCVYHEVFDTTRQIAFGLIWIGLVVFCWDLRRRARSRSRK